MTKLQAMRLPLELMLQATLQQEPVQVALAERPQPMEQECWTSRLVRDSVLERLQLLQAESETQVAICSVQST
jgi:hypothetical protein